MICKIYNYVMRYWTEEVIDMDTCEFNGAYLVRVPYKYTQSDVIGIVDLGLFIIPLVVCVFIAFPLHVLFKILKTIVLGTIDVLRWMNANITVKCSKTK